MRLLFRMIPVLVLFVLFAVRGETTKPGQGSSRSVTAGPFFQKDTSGVIVIRIYRDSVNNGNGTYLPLEARVVEGKIISVFVDGKETEPDAPLLPLMTLNTLLNREKELKNKLFQLMNRITDLKKELDSISNAPFRVAGHLFLPGEDLQEQVMAVTEEEQSRLEPPADTLPQGPVMPPDTRIDSLMTVLLNLRALRDQNAAMVKEELKMLEKQEEEIREQLRKIDESFGHEERVIPDRKEKKKKGKSRKKRRKPKKNRS